MVFYLLWQKGITLSLINLDHITLTKVGLSIENITIVVASNQQINQTRRTHSSKLEDIQFTIEEYHLTTKDGNLHSYIGPSKLERINCKFYGDHPFARSDRSKPHKPDHHCSFIK